MENVDFRLLERFAASRRRHAQPSDEELEWLEPLRICATGDTEHAAAADVTPRRVRALDLRD